MGTKQSSLRIASVGDLEELLPMVVRYHETEEIISSPRHKRDALLSLLRVLWGMCDLICLFQLGYGAILVLTYVFYVLVCRRQLDMLYDVN